MKTKLLKLSSVLFLFVISILVWKLNTNENTVNETLKSKKINAKTIEKSIVEVKKDCNSFVSVNKDENIQKNNRVSSKLITDVNQNVELKTNYSSKEIDSIENIRTKYLSTIVDHPLRKQMRLPKKERKAMGLPPNAFNEQDWLYTMDPNLGRSRPEVLFDLQRHLDKEIEEGRVPGDGLDNQWIERGPNNVGGRTRALIFAPGSTTKVIAGGVSGGVWINNDITNSASSWVQASGVPGNLSVSCITVDPNNSNIMYVGTGEAYTGGAVVGNGVYKSIDGGNNWRLVFSAATGAALADMVVSVTDIKAWRNPSTNLTEVFFGVDGLYLYSDYSPGSLVSIGNNTIGLYRSTDGENFTKQTTASLQTTSTTRYVAPCSFTVNSAGELLMGTKSNNYNTGGGRVYKCTNGTNWTLIRTLAGVNGRVHLVASPTTAGRVYALCEDATNNLPVIKRSTDGFATVDTTISLPTSIGNQPPAANDFCRSQAFYDLMIGMNPTNDNEIYVAGIEIFKTTTAFTANATSMWTQLTDWTLNPSATGNATAGTLDGVHSDHHIMAFCPTQTTRVVFGCDGGVYYSNDSGNAIGERNKDYNVTQVYKGSIDQSTAGNKMLGGLQDNGSQLVSNPATTGPGIEVFGGDGCWEFIDKQQQYLVNSYVYNTYIYSTYAGVATAYIANDSGSGDFVNQCGLDSSANILYTNGTVGGTFQINRYTINPTNGATTAATLTNAAVNAIPTYFEPSPFATNTIMVGLSTGRLIRMTNANATPTFTTLTTPFTGAISDIKFGNTANDIFVTLHNYGITNVWYTADGGTNWQNKEGNLPNLPVRCILQNPNATNEVIIGTDLGVWYTVDFNAASPTWRRANSGMKDVKVFSLDYRSADNTILAATFGRGMWTGKFWQCGTSVKTWNGTAWSPVGTPTSKDAVVFAGNYSSTASLDACSVTVNTGVNVVFNSTHTLRVGENITVNGTGTLTINNNAALVQYTKHAVNTGNIIVKRNSANMIRQDYTAWGSPVTGQNLLAFSPNTIATRFYQYLYTGTSTPTAYQSVTPSTNTFALAKGYMIRVDNTWTSTAPGVAYAGQFTGVPNNGSITYSVGQGYNLLGNPYASPINAKTFLINNPKVDALYYWTHTVPASGGVYPTNNYASYTMLGGTASSNGSAVPNDYIQVGQGFFVQATTAYTVNFENEYRVDATNSTQFFRQQQSVTLADDNVEKHRIWLNLNDATQKHNQILVGYMDGATDGVDRKIDGLVFDTSKTMLYSLIDNKEYVIQGKGLPFNDEDVVKIGFKATEASNFEINLEQFDGLFTNQDIYLKDNLIGSIHNLKNGSYYFISQAGVYNDRFEIIYKKPENTIINESDSSVYLFKGNDGVLVVNSNKLKIIGVEVYDVLGKQLYKTQSDHTSVNLKQFGSNQTLIVQITLENGEKVIKKTII